MSNFKDNILNFSKNLIGKSALKAIDYILSPCCSNGNIETITISGLTIKGKPINNKKIKVVILVEDNEAAVGFGVGTTNGSGDVVIS
jgi:hypothetical protein